MAQFARLDLAERAARAGGSVASRAFRTDHDVETKDHKTDIVTAADVEAQQSVVDAIRAVETEAVIVAEEDDESADLRDRSTIPEDGDAWIVDPIDGTSNYVRGLRTWTTSVAFVSDGEPVAAASVFPVEDDVVVAGESETRRNGQRVSVSDASDPETFAVAPLLAWQSDCQDEFVAACRAIIDRFGDLRRVGSTQAMLAYVATGGLEAVITNRRGPAWDTVAGVHLVEQAGGTVTDLDGDPWQYDSQGLVASNGRRHDLLLAAAAEIEAARSSG